ncbi:MAG: glycosyltransferase family 9 protein [Culturomica sp.]|jgi:heptosyltransferase-2|nr:glycosyltransferase family 9 protein [Culturomica sp.]
MDKEVTNILILRFRRVGDAVLSSALCSSLKKSFPNAQIHYVLNEEIAPLFENHPEIDRIITFRKEEMKSWRRYIAKVRSIVKTGKYDVIVDTRTTVKTLWFSLFSLSTPFRIGRKKNYNFILHNYRINNDFDGKENEVDSTLRLLSPLEKTYKIHYDPHFKLYVTPREKEAFRAKMESKGIDFTKPVVVCAVATRIAHKAWDMERMKLLLLRIIGQYDIQLIFNYGGEAEKNAALRLHRALDNHPNIFTNIEAHNLRELAAMMANSDFFLGNEGGPRHISQALNICSFAIYPPHISKKQWLPNAGERFQGIETADISPEIDRKKLSYQEQFDLITVDNVWEKLKPMLDTFLVPKPSTRV